MGGSAKSWVSFGFWLGGMDAACYGRQDARRYQLKAVPGRTRLLLLASLEIGTLRIELQFDFIRKNARLVLLVVVTRNCVFETMVWMEARVSVVQLPPGSDAFSKRNGAPFR